MVFFGQKLMGDLPFEEVILNIILSPVYTIATVLLIVGVFACHGERCPRS